MRVLQFAFAFGIFSLFCMPPACAEGPHNLILFVPDGLRALMVDEDKAPAMAALRAKGVNFKNPHALFPTFTTANASAMATGHLDPVRFDGAVHGLELLAQADRNACPQVCFRVAELAIECAVRCGGWRRLGLRRRRHLRPEPYPPMLAVTWPRPDGRQQERTQRCVPHGRRSGCALS